jgi:L-seryl-tRNA(Ser) seleniumtransferase
LKDLPQIGKLLESKEFSTLNEKSVKKIAQKILDSLRDDVKNSKPIAITHEDIKNQILSEYELLKTPSMTPLINATGVVIHTNLGRAPISKEILISAADNLKTKKKIQNKTLPQTILSLGTFKVTFSTSTKR